MMKLVNRLLVIAVIAFGSWFLVQQWDKVERPQPVNETETTSEEDVAQNTDSTADDTLLVFDVDPSDKPERKIQEPATEKKNTATKIVSYAAPVQKEVEVEEIAEEVIIENENSMTVYLFEGGFDISTSEIKEGHITFNVRNDGRMSHDFSIEGVKDFGRIVPGEIKSFTQYLRAGEYTLFSPREVDQRLNMRENLIVESAR